MFSDSYVTIHLGQNEREEQVMMVCTQKGDDERKGCNEEFEPPCPPGASLDIPHTRMHQVPACGLWWAKIKKILVSRTSKGGKWR